MHSHRSHPSGSAPGRDCYTLLNTEIEYSGIVSSVELILVRLCRKRANSRWSVHMFEL